MAKTYKDAWKASRFARDQRQIWQLANQSHSCDQLRVYRVELVIEYLIDRSKAIGLQTELLD